MIWRVDGSAAKLRADAANLLWNTWLTAEECSLLSTVHWQRETSKKLFQSWHVAACVAFKDCVSVQLQNVHLYLLKNNQMLKNTKTAYPQLYWIIKVSGFLFGLFFSLMFLSKSSINLWLMHTTYSPRPPLNSDFFTSPLVRHTVILITEGFFFSPLEQTSSATSARNQSSNYLPAPRGLHVTTRA